MTTKFKKGDRIEVTKSSELDSGGLNSYTTGEIGVVIRGPVAPYSCVNWLRDHDGAEITTVLANIRKVTLSPVTDHAPKTQEDFATLLRTLGKEDLKTFIRRKFELGKATLERALQAVACNLQRPLSMGINPIWTPTAPAVRRIDSKGVTLVLNHNVPFSEIWIGPPMQPIEVERYTLSEFRDSYRNETHRRAWQACKSYRQIDPLHLAVAELQDDQLFEKPEPKKENEERVITHTASFIFEDGKTLDIPEPREGWTLEAYEELITWPGWYCRNEWPIKPISSGYLPEKAVPYGLWVARGAPDEGMISAHLLEFRHKEAQILLADMGPILADKQAKCLSFSTWVKDVEVEVFIEEKPLNILREKLS